MLRVFQFYDAEKGETNGGNLLMAKEFRNHDHEV